MVPWLRIRLPEWRTQVRSLVGELRSHMLYHEPHLEKAHMLQRRPSAAKAKTNTQRNGREKQGCRCPMVIFGGHRTHREGREDQGWKQTAGRSVLAPGTMLPPALSPAVCDCPLRTPLLSACPHSILASHRLTLKSVIVTTYLVKHDQRPPPMAPHGLSAGPSTNRALVGCPASLPSSCPEPCGPGEGAPGPASPDFSLKEMSGYWVQRTHPLTHPGQDFCSQ